VKRSFLLIFALVFLAACAGSSDDSVGGGADSTDIDRSEHNDQTDDVEDERPSISVASAWLPASLDPAPEGYSLIQRGAAETLTRISPDQSIEPWLAESVEHVEEATWEVVLREDVLFWDGDELTSQHIIDSIERSWEEQPASTGFLPETTDLEIIDDRTLELTLPEPDSALPHNLATPQLAIHKMSDDAAIMTGPYIPVTLRADDELILESFDDYWGGVPPYTQITVQRVSDGNARELAVQAGDVDIITEAPPEAAEKASGEVASKTVDSTRVHYTVLNHNRAPFDDEGVRAAVNLAIDRDELNEVALGGLGGPLTTIIPPGIGIETPEQFEHDVEAAREMLNDAGWEIGPDNVRTRDGEPLEFLLYSYPGRPELTPIAVSIQDQLARIGFDVSIQEVEDINEAMENPAFQATMFSINMLPNGDPAYALQMVGSSDGSSNYGNHQRDEFDSLLNQIRLADDGDDRNALILEAQQMLQDDAAALFLMSAPRSVIYRPDRMEEPDLHPSEMYFIHTDLPAPVGGQ
jgi:peptide/nickel transport system substrate-binding protein